MESSIIISN